MKKIIKDILYGFLVLVVIILCEFIVTLPFGLDGGTSQTELIKLLNREFLLTALPALFVTYGFAWLLKTKTMMEAAQRSIIWTALVLLNFVFIGLGNNNFLEIFSSLGMYVLLFCTFMGPILYFKLIVKK